MSHPLNPLMTRSRGAEEEGGRLVICVAKRLRETILSSSGDIFISERERNCNSRVSTEFHGGMYQCSFDVKTTQPESHRTDGF